MATHDQMFRSETGPPDYTVLGKYPYIYFADAERSALASYGYINNSLEGAEFDTSQAGNGQVANSLGQPFTPNFYYMNPLYPSSGAATFNAGFPVSEASILNGVCTITAISHTYSVGDIVAINGIDFDATHPFINGTWIVYSISANTFDFEINAENVASYGTLASSSGSVRKDPVFQIADYRPTSDAKGKSFTSVLFTMKKIYDVPVGFKRVLPSDLYTRFRFQTGSDIVPQGGINSNLFSVLGDDGTTNIKPVLWAYFFGYNDKTIATRITATQFEIAFNSYAIVLRPSGIGSNLEFAIVKFNWRTDAGSTWLSSIVDQQWFKKYTISGTDLGYLISSNPAIGTNKVSELAKSDSFTYSSELPVKLNLKITIRKHLLSDSELDLTYLVNLMINDNYNVFGEGAHYDSILHAYITKPGYDISDTGPFNVADGNHPHDCMLMPMMYFKFNNINEEYVSVPGFDVSYPGSSKIVQDSLFFRQINSVFTNSVAENSYLY